MRSTLIKENELGKYESILYKDQLRKQLLTGFRTLEISQENIRGAVLKLQIFSIIFSKQDTTKDVF